MAHLQFVSQSKKEEMNAKIFNVVSTAFEALVLLGTWLYLRLPHFIKCIFAHTTEVDGKKNSTVIRQEHIPLSCTLYNIAVRALVPTTAVCLMLFVFLHDCKKFNACHIILITSNSFSVLIFVTSILMKETSE